jgi:arylsulfatase A-like enzyme
MRTPNILFILIDDLGWRDLACYGSTFYETPNLDRLARQGMLFTDAYASCPVCSPTRASILTGKYPARVGVTDWIGGQSEGRLAHVPYLHYLPLEETTLATALREHGYQTWHVGKWHLGDEPFWPDKQGFDVNVGGCHWGMPKNGYFAPWGIPSLEEAPEGTYLTDHLTDRAIDLIENRDERPFFLHLSHHAVHTPIQAPGDLVEKYERKARRLKLDRIDPIVVGEPFPSVHKNHLNVERRMIQSDPAYAAMVENMDTNIGRVLTTLETEGIVDDTIVIFTSDNGGLSSAEGSPTCNLPLSEGKGWTYEGGTRVCQIVRWPGVVEPGARCHAPVTSTDFYPTLLEATGAPMRPEQHADGMSLVPLLKGAERLDREAIYWHYPHYANQGGRPAASLVSGKWKLIENFEDGRLELYDLDADIGETIDLSQREPETTRRLYKMLKDWQKEIEAKIPDPNPDWQQKLKRPSVPNNAHE